MIDIDSTKHWVHTGATLRAGRTYRLTATGEWRDQQKRCGPDGYNSLDYPDRITRWLLWCTAWTRRVWRARWFTLIGALDSRRHAKFAIGSAATVTPQRDGELLCFANDCLLTYGNNHGTVHLEIEELNT